MGLLPLAVGLEGLLASADLPVRQLGRAGMSAGRMAVMRRARAGLAGEMAGRIIDTHSEQRTVLL